MSRHEVDWPVILTAVGVLIAAVGTAAAIFAAVFSGKSLRLQRKQIDASPAGADVSERELFLLRLLHKFGPLKSGYSYQDGAATVIAHRLVRATLHVVPANRAEPNAWVFGSLAELVGRGLVDQRDGHFEVSDAGRAVIGRDRKTVVDASLYPIDYVDLGGTAVAPLDPSSR